MNHINLFLTKLDLRSSNKHVALENFLIYYTWKNIRKQLKKNKTKKIAPKWNDQFELLIIKELIDKTKNREKYQFLK